MVLWSKEERNGKGNSIVDLNLLPGESSEKCNESKTKPLEVNVIYEV